MTTTPNSQPPHSPKSGGFKLQSLVGWILQPFKWYEARLISIVKEQITNEKVGELEKKVTRIQENHIDNLQDKLDDLRDRIKQVKDDTHHTSSRLERDIDTKIETLKQKIPQLAFSPLQENLSIIKEDFVKIINPIIDFAIKQKIAEIERISVAGSAGELEQSQAEKKELEAAKAEVENYLTQSEACRKAAKWLADERENLAREAVEDFLKDQPELRNPGGTLDSPEKVKRLFWDIDDCLWVTTRCLAEGKKPEILLRGITDEPALSKIEPYVQVLELIRDRKVNEAKSANKLSEEAAEQVRGYLAYVIDNSKLIFLKAPQ